MYYNREKRKFCVTSSSSSSSSSSSGLEEDIHMGAEGEGLMTLGTLNDARHLRLTSRRRAHDACLVHFLGPGARVWQASCCQL